MATMTVWKFATADGAEEALYTLEDLQRQGLVEVEDAAVVTWPAKRRKPKTRRLHDLAGGGALDGAFWGLLFGVLFFLPLIGLAVGAAAGLAATGLSRFGIDEDFVRRVREKVTPGTSALFVLTSGAVVDRVREAFGGVHVELLASNLSREQEDQLRHVFADDEAVLAPQA